MTYPHTTFKLSPRYDQLQGNCPTCFSPYPPPPVPFFLWVFKVPQGLLTTVVCCYLSVTHLIHWVLWCKHPSGLYSSRPPCLAQGGVGSHNLLTFHGCSVVSSLNANTRFWDLSCSTQVTLPTSIPLQYSVYLQTNQHSPCILCACT